MFGGIVEGIGVIQAEKMDKGCKCLSIKPQFVCDDVKIGDSIAVNGVCLTVAKISESGFDFCAVPETLALTNLGQLSKDSRVNLERSLKADSRIGGHNVQGHVDGVGEIIRMDQDGSALLVDIKIHADLSRYIVKKGYITLDGMSITVMQADAEQFRVTFIPHTQEVTIVNEYRPGSKINIEVDILGKYLEKLLEGSRNDK